MIALALLLSLVAGPSCVMSTPTDLAGRLVVKVSDGVATVSLRPDWRGMNAHTLGVWRMPLDAHAVARLAELGISADLVTEAARKPWARVGGVTI
jgi:hypothetical protein